MALLATCFTFAGSRQLKIVAIFLSSKASCAPAGFKESSGTIILPIFCKFNLDNKKMPYLFLKN